jgi:metal-dependent HD superfamily phosphatase/phosphodiesterase
MTYESIKNDSAIITYIQNADASLRALGFTEHSFQHVCLVAERAGKILEALGFDARTAELARIAGLLHDIGNLVNRVQHSQSGALMAFRILDQKGFDPSEISLIVSAIGNHDEGTGIPVNEIAAALILADKADVRKTRVRNQNQEKFDIHDRVNFSVETSLLSVFPEEKKILLELSIDTEVSPVMDFFEIFTERMRLCEKAAQKLGCRFALIINKTTLL